MRVILCKFYKDVFVGSTFPPDLPLPGLSVSPAHCPPSPGLSTPMAPERKIHLDCDTGP